MEINVTWDELLASYQDILAGRPITHKPFREHVKAIIDLIPKLKEELDLADDVTKWSSHWTLCFGFPDKKTHVSVWYDIESVLFEVYVVDSDRYLDENYDHERVEVPADQVIPTIQRTLERVRNDDKYA